MKCNMLMFSPTNMESAATKKVTANLGMTADYLEYYIQPRVHNVSGFQQGPPLCT